MGAKITANTATKTLVVTVAPDINGFIDLNVQVDVWSDLLEDWETDVNLRKHTFPIVLIGAQTTSAGKLGATYVLREPWHMHPYEADHDFNIDGNLFTELATTKLVAPTIGTYTVTVNRNLSTLVEVVESDVSGLTAEERQELSDMHTRLYSGQLHVDETRGKEVIKTAAGVPFSEADVWSDDGVTRYDGTAGVARRDGHVKP